MLDKIDHIGIVVVNPDGALRQFTEVFGLTCLEIKEIESIGLRTAFFNFLDWEGGPFMRYALGDILEVHTAPCACGMPGIRFKIVGRADEMLIVKGVNVYPGAIKNAIEKFFPRTTGALRILLDRPGPLVSPPLKIRLEHAPGMDSTAISALDEEMVVRFREDLRINPQFIWVPPGTIPRETGKTKLLEIANHGKDGR